MTTSQPLLSIRDLSIGVDRSGQQLKIVEQLDLEIGQGQRVGLVGESGSGKSMALRSIAGLLPRGVKVLSGSIEYDGESFSTCRPHDAEGSWVRRSR